MFIIHAAMKRDLLSIAVELEEAKNTVEATATCPTDYAKVHMFILSSSRSKEYGPTKRNDVRLDCQGQRLNMQRVTTIKDNTKIP
jgi:hypothetical protein